MAPIQKPEEPKKQTPQGRLSSPLGGRLRSSLFVYELELDDIGGLLPLRPLHDIELHLLAL